MNRNSKNTKRLWFALYYDDPLVHPRILPSQQTVFYCCLQLNWTVSEIPQLVHHLLPTLLLSRFSRTFDLSLKLNCLIFFLHLIKNHVNLTPSPFVIVDVLDDIVPFLLYLFNRSLSEGLLPASQKRAIVFPTLKKPNLDPSICQNYRPIANLSFLSKTLERLVSLQLLPYLEQSGLLPPRQSGNSLLMGSPLN